MEQPKEITTVAVQLTEDAGVLAVETWPEITSQSEYEQAASARKEAKGKIKELNSERLAITRPLDESKKKVMAFFAAPVDALTKFIGAVDIPMIAYSKKQEEERQAEEKRLLEEAEAKAKEEAEEALKIADELEQSGSGELAEEIREEVTTTEVIPEQATVVVAKAQGTSTRTVAKCECTDKMALIKSIAEGKAPERLLDVNTQMLKRYCEVNGSAPDGCRTWEDTIIVSR